MNFDGIRVNHGALEQASSDMQATVKEIDTRMDRLEKDLMEIARPDGSGWSGHAQQSYLVAKAKWDTAINEMRDLLTETHLEVTNSNAEYRAADLRGASQFQ